MHSPRTTTTILPPAAFVAPVLRNHRYFSPPPLARVPPTILSTTDIIIPATSFRLPMTSSSSTSSHRHPTHPHPDTVDYLVVGAGATGMSFCDTLLHHHHFASSSMATSTFGDSGDGDGGDGGRGPSVLLIDDHPRPGGQWNDSYDFVRLHQPSQMYGVESTVLGGGTCGRTHRATRREVLDYYDQVCDMLESKFDFHFLGETHVDLDALGYENDDDDDDDNDDDDDVEVERSTTMTEIASPTTGEDDDGRMAAGTAHHRGGYVRCDLSNGRTVRAGKVVDARYLKPDLPIQVPPRFVYDSKFVRCIPVNDLSCDGGDECDGYDGEGGGKEGGRGGGEETTTANGAGRYVVIGAGKTGMDAITYLLNNRGVDPTNDVMWIVPNEAWITARENIGSCLEFLHDCTTLLARRERGGQRHSSNDGVDDVTTKSVPNDFFHNGYLEWERRGRVYRFDEGILPTKFKDATLCREEMDLLKKVSRVVRRGRVASIDDDGTMHFDDGTSMGIPWSITDTTFVHCSAGAFNYSKRIDTPPPIFSRARIVIQDVYGTPGFCFVGSIIGKIEGLGGMLSDDEKNSMCSVPCPDPDQARLPLGPSGGDIGVLTKSHGYVRRLANLRKWLQVPEIRGWLAGHRLFNLGHLTAEDMDALVEETWSVLEKYNVVSSFE